MTAQTVVQIDAKNDERTAVRKDEVIAEQNAATIARIGVRTAELSGETFAQISAMTGVLTGAKSVVSNVELNAEVKDAQNVVLTVDKTASLSVAKSAVLTGGLNAGLPTGLRTAKSVGMPIVTATVMRAGIIIEIVDFAIISHVGSIDHDHATTSPTIAVPTNQG